MRNGFFFPTAMAVMMLAACSSTDDELSGQMPGQSSGTGDGRASVGFSAYLNRSTSRSGTGGLLTTDGTNGSISLQNEGFGVFGYYTDLRKYDRTYVPNFMYNTHVTYSAVAGWTYSPVMYWPNEYGSSALSDDEDKVSFFAYAPYVQHASPQSGNVADATYGITGFTRNSVPGDPMVKYIASFDASKSVDLCWGVVGPSETSWSRIQGDPQTFTAGKPWIDVEHPKGVTDQKLKFTFRHALAQLNVQIDADVNVNEHADGTGLDVIDPSTRVYVRSISFTGIAMQGALNLNNQTANEARWLDYSGTTDLPYGQSITVNDGLRDGREGADAVADNEVPIGLSTGIIQNSSFTGGVTTTLQNAFKGATLTTPVCVIPTGENMKVTIVYDVETVNPNLPGYISDGTTHGVSIENRITKNIVFAGGGLQSGKKYTLKLHLGMNTVKFEALVDAWDDNASEANGWLPSNGGALSLSLGAASSMSLFGGSQSLTASSSATTYTFTNSNDQVVSIMSPSGTRGGTRGVQTIPSTTSNTITITPVGVGTATITCTDSDGNTASTVITVYNGREIVLPSAPNDGQKKYYAPGQVGNALDALTTGVKDAEDHNLTIGTDYKVTITDPSGTEHVFTDQASLDAYVNQVKSNGAEGDYVVKVTGVGDYEGNETQDTVTLVNPAADPITPSGVASEYDKSDTQAMADDLTSGVEIGDKSAGLGDTNGYTISIKDASGNPLNPAISGIDDEEELKAALDNLAPGTYTIEYTGQGTNTGATGTKVLTIKDNDVKPNPNSINDWNGDNQIDVSFSNN